MAEARTGEEKFLRAETITKSLVQDLKIAIENDATLAAGNMAVAPLRGVQWYGARFFNSIQRALTMDLALSLARLFDEGRSDVASIPKLVSLLRDTACRAEIEKRAAGWMLGLRIITRPWSPVGLSLQSRNIKLFKGTRGPKLRPPRFPHGQVGAQPARSSGKTSSALHRSFPPAERRGLHHC